MKEKGTGVLRKILALAVSYALVLGPLAMTPVAAAAAPRRDHNDRNVTENEGSARFDDGAKHDDKGRDDDDRRGDFDHHHHLQPGGCRLNSARGEIQHVIYIQFDNVHFERDNPNVPSDLESMPNLLNFVQDNGTLLTNSHTPLISHTADDIITSLTGVYGDRHGDAVANSFGFFPAAGSSTAADLFQSSFVYWNDKISSATTPTDPNYILLTANGQNAPAPWVPYTRAGCNFGAVSIANMEFENITNDITTVFSPTSPEYIEATTATACTPSSSATCTALKNTAIADFEGIAIHCSAGDTLCSAANGGGADVLPQEPGGYSGFNALYGHKYAVPAINGGSTSLKDLDGNVITDTHSNIGFPGFSGINAAQALSYVAQMQEHGVPVTYAYISDAHDNPSAVSAHPPAACTTDPETGALGPGDICHEAILAAYNQAFGAFFARLKTDGITPANTLFLITTEEQDHFAGGPPAPANCDGVTTFCTYSKLGEVDANTNALLQIADPSLATTTTTFDIHFDSSPTFYLKGNPAPTAAITREYERAAGKLQGVSPITGASESLTAALADPVGMKLLHMITGDPQRTPNFVLFGNPDYFFETAGSSPFTSSTVPNLVKSPAFAWNHGDIQPEITTVWCGLVGPGVQARGIDGGTFASETDYRPTMLALLGLTDDYQHEGRVLAEDLKSWAIPQGIRESGDEFQELARAFEQIDSPLGQLSKDGLIISTAALNGNDTNDATYAKLENELTNITSARDAIAGRMLELLEGATFEGRRIREDEERPLTRAAQLLLEYTHTIAGNL